ncbi:hypothetical protein Scep_015300 [Stephania cephalantha]|uniref:DNA polymerase epsilon catalytic subunit n=1 Tax=Stephania cephalantha TaxID=152367 RepID=A0AAP0J2Y8_9MAGN
MDRNKRDRGDYRDFKKQRLNRSVEEEREAKLGFDVFSEGEKRLGWLLTFASSSFEDPDSNKVYSCVDLYFVSQDGSTFKAKYKFPPYFYAATKDGMEMGVEAYLKRRYEGQIADIEIMEKEDLDLVSFDTVQQLMRIKNDLLRVVERNQLKNSAAEAYEAILTGKSNQGPQDFIDCIVDLREYDVPYHVRFAIDNDVRCGQWYDVSVSSSSVSLKRRSDLLQRAEVRVCAFDIETTKFPLKFPDAKIDSIMMISYMVDGQGYLIINREVHILAIKAVKQSLGDTPAFARKRPTAYLIDGLVVASKLLQCLGEALKTLCVWEDIENLEYTPKPEFEGYFKVKNVKNEEELLRQWFSHMLEVKPGIYVTYNGDFFDWPFLETRAAHYGIVMSDEIGFQCDRGQDECRAKFACHLDCICWVKRDSYLPQGSHGLKAVTKAKLGYDPLEVNPEDMVRFAKERPQMMASYSVSDAVATYYLYMTYVHPFIFSLATIIPMPPDEVLRKGSGTLCEMLLMVQAYQANVICPNKYQADLEKFHNGHLLESETYIGGHVECLECGVFRSDLPAKFHLVPTGYQLLIDNLDRDLQYAISVEGKMDVEMVLNYEEVKNAINEKLVKLRDEPIREECPLIYHLDVAAMYPNIILTNRLQPPSIVSDEDCTACDFNRPGKTCLRKLEWRQLESELVVGGEGQLSKSFLDLPKVDQQAKLKERLKKYCQKAYKRVLEKPVTELREAGICMRENPFYADTVRSFRDRRYEYKGLNKVWKGKLADAKASGNSLKIQEAQDMVVLYDSLQLAHKCILNSFYGYVMRKGARWFSMEMAGVVTYTGAKIIQNARLLVEKIGRPLELDTDGIWCALPGSFPENFTFKTKDSKKKLTISYPCVMLNVDVARNNTNHQYQTLKDPVAKTYTTHSECSIEFEVDGPYKAMILPASKEEGVLIKKRYAVFNDDGTLAELKGFEIKRRVEVFEKFLHGNTLEECYAQIASVANRWLDLLDVEYGEQKSCAVTTARRIADFLDATMVKDKGLLCQYVIACEPQGTPVSERAIPVAIFGTGAEKKYFLRKWCKISSDVGIRSIVDWSYYKQRLGSAIQKIITIPAAMQKVANPVPRVVHPDWLHKKVKEKADKFRQKKLSDIFGSLKKGDVEDFEDFRNKDTGSNIYPRPVVRSYEADKEQQALSKSLSTMVNVQQRVDMSSNLHLQHISPSDQSTTSSEDIDKNVDYLGWLEVKKRKWKFAREERKKRRLGNLKRGRNSHGVSEFPGHKQNQVRSGVGSFFKRHDLALVSSYWQIIQLAPSSKPGHFFAWVIVEGIMHKVPIRVPRVFYLNTKAPITEEFPGKRVNKTLPHGHTSYNLIEVIIDEDQFRAEGKKLAAHLADPEVEGIYESKIPLDFNAILQIGCVCKVDKAAKSRNPQDGWNLMELHMKTTTECSYLEQSLSFFYLYHSMSEGRGIYVTYFPASGTIVVVVINPFQNKELSPSFVEKLFREACQVLSSDAVLPSTGAVFKVDYVRHVKDAEKLMQKTINEYRHQHHGPAIGVIECPKILSTKSGIHVLNDFPCVCIPCNARDSQYQALGWQVVAAKIGMQRCAASSQWFAERISLSRYAHVPLGNFDLDWILFTADIFFSRKLHEQQQVLWISDDGVPDLGGLSEEDTCFADEIHHLAVNALLKSNQLNELEGGALFGFEQETGLAHGQSGFDESTSCAYAFRVLKQLIQRCLEDAIKHSNVFADAVLQHLYRWLCSPQSKLHDPALHQMLHKVMQKVFLLLLAELRKLGSTVIFADFSKVIIDTGKSDLSAAQAYCDCLLKTLHSRQVFSTGLVGNRVTVNQRYGGRHVNVIFNYGGIQARTIGSLSADNPEAPNDGAKDKIEVDLVSSWNIAEYLPKEIQDHFVLIVSEFIYKPWEHAQKQASSSDCLVEGSLCTPSITTAAAAVIESKITEYLKEQISSYFTDKLLKIVRNMVHHLKVVNNSGGNEISQGHARGGSSNVHMVDAALEFIKHVCAVLILDHNVQHDILVMRKNLLKYVRVREFDPGAFFCYPSLSFILPNVICSYCNDCRDLDLCRDPALLAQELRCAVPQCGQPYDREVMENALLQIVRQRERLYHLQDLICLKCKEIKAAHSADQCKCGGSFKTKEDESEFKVKMQVFLTIATRQKFQLLKECVSWILEV